jgi:hypothetical protein
MPKENERSPGRRGGADADTDPDVPQSPDGQRERNPSRPNEGEDDAE